MLLGALTSFLVSFYTGMIWIGLLAAVLVGVAANIILAWMYVTVPRARCGGIGVQCSGTGVASAVYRRALGNSAVPESIAMFQPLHIPLLGKLPVIGPVVFGQTILFYLTIALAFVAHFILFRTNFGLALRASGENPAAADSAGISVSSMRYAGTLISGAAAGMAGGYLVLAQVGLFRESIVSGKGSSR